MSVSQTIGWTRNRRTGIQSENQKRAYASLQVRKGGLPRSSAGGGTGWGNISTDITGKENSLLMGTGSGLRDGSSNLNAEVSSRALGARAGASHPSSPANWQCLSGQNGTSLVRSQ